MIDIIKRPDQNFGKINKTNSFPVIKLVILALVLVAAIGVGWVLYYYSSNSRTLNFREKEEYKFGDFALVIDKIEQTTCPQVATFDCASFQPEDTVQLHFTNKATDRVTYGYLGKTTASTLQQQGLRLELVSINLDKKTTRIKLIKEQ